MLGWGFVPLDWYHGPRSTSVVAMVHVLLHACYTRVPRPTMHEFCVLFDMLLNNMLLYNVTANV